jgi:hypothetical protein
MRTVLRIFAIAVFVSPFIGNAQQKETEFICKKVDPFDDSVTFQNSSAIILYTDGGDMSTEGLIFYPYPSESRGNLSLRIMMKAAGMDKCVDEGNPLNIIFENGEKLELVNYNDFDCDGYNYFRVPVNKNQLNLLRNEPIKALRYQNKRDYQSFTVLENMTDEASNMFINVMREIDEVNEGKAVVQICN